MHKILIIEDELLIREELSLLLLNAGYKVIAPGLNDTVTPFTDIDELLSAGPDLILLDINLPGTDGFSLCSKIRSASPVPIIFITGRNTSTDELKALTLGGDDYITKPYDVPVLLARVAAVLRRTAADERSNLLEYHGISLNLPAATLTYRDQTIDLTKKELQILYYLFSHSGEFVSRMDLIEYLWTQNIYTEDNVLSVNMTRIREKLETLGIADLIQTKRGMGYKV